MDYRLLLPLDSFLNGFFLPALWRCSRQQGRSEHDANFARLVLFESVAWLSVGAELGIFPPQAAQDLCTQYFPAVNEQYRLYPDEIMYIVRDDQKGYLQSVLEKGRLNLLETYNSAANDALFSRFEIILDLIANVGANQSIRSMCTAILLFDERTWNLLSSSVSGENLLACIHGTQDVWIDGNRGFAFAGVFRTIQHLENLLDLLDYRHRPAFADFSDWGLLRQTVYAAHRWRFDLQDEAYFQRFVQLASVLIHELDPTDLGFDLVDSRSFLRYIEDLRKRWRSLEGLVANASS